MNVDTGQGAGIGVDAVDADAGLDAMKQFIVTFEECR